jgi:ketosteroid isomerase-like protein
MRRFILGALLGLAACTPAAPTPAGLTDADRAAIQAVSDGFAQSVLAANWDAAMQAYTEDAVLMPPNDRLVQGAAAIREYLSAFPPVLEFSLMNESVEGAGDLAYVRGRYAMKLGLPGEPVDSGKYVEVRRRGADGSWKLTVDIWNSSLTPAAPSGQ